jgi:hypothetical protein
VTVHQREAHLRMLSTLSHRVRTHHQPDPERWNGHVPKAARPVVVKGVTYRSMAEAGRKSGISRAMIYILLTRGDPRCRYGDK